MNTPKVGEYFSFDEYKPIILTGDKEKDTQALASANGLSYVEAKRQLDQNPALQGFYENMLTEDEEENIVITDDDLDLDFDEEPDMNTVGRNNHGATAGRAKGAGAADGAASTAGNNSSKLADLIMSTPTGPNASIKIEVQGDTIKITGQNYQIDMFDIPNDLLNKVTVQLEGKNLTFNAAKGLKQVVNNADDSTIKGSSGRDNIVNNGKNCEVKGGSGDDIIVNNGDGTTIIGGSGDDNITNNAADVQIEGGSGDDRVTNNAEGTDTTINLGSGDDTFINKADNVFVNGGAGDDSITNQGGKDFTAEDVSGDNSIVENGTPAPGPTPGPTPPEPTPGPTPSEPKPVSEMTAAEVRAALNEIYDQQEALLTEIDESDDPERISACYQELIELNEQEEELALRTFELLAQSENRTLSDEEKAIISSMYDAVSTRYSSMSKANEVQIIIDELKEELEAAETDEDKEELQKYIDFYEGIIKNNYEYAADESLENSEYSAVLANFMISDEFKSLSDEEKQEFLEMASAYVEKANEYVDNLIYYTEDDEMTSEELNAYFAEKIVAFKADLDADKAELDAKIAEIQNPNTTPTTPPITETSGTLTINAGETQTVLVDGITYQIGCTEGTTSAQVEYSVKDGVMSIKGDNITFAISNIQSGKQPPKINFEGNNSVIATFDDSHSTVKYDDIVNVTGWGNEIYVYGGDDKITSDGGNGKEALLIGNYYDLGEGNDELWLQGGAAVENDDGDYDLFSEEAQLAGSYGEKNIYWFNDDSDVETFIITKDGRIIDREVIKEDDGSSILYEDIYQDDLPVSGQVIKKDANGKVTETTTYEYKYDDDNVISYTEITKDGKGKVTEEYTLEYERDDNGYIVGIHQKLDDKKEHLTLSIDRTYDTAGNLTSYTYQAEDTRTNAIYNIEITFEYDDNGKLIGAQRKIINKGETTTETIDDIDFEHISNELGIQLCLGAEELSENMQLSDRMKNDIEIVKAAEKSSDYDKAIRDAMIKNFTSYTFNTTTNTSNIPQTELDKIDEGAVIEIKNEKGENILCVKESGKLVALNISADTYLELFPPVERYDVSQNTIGDCYFISGAVIDMLKNPTTFAKLLQQFTENDDGSLSFTFKGLKNKDGNEITVTFERDADGKLVLKTIDGDLNDDGKMDMIPYTQVSGALGVQMIEQAYAIGRFAVEEEVDIDDIDIDAAIELIEGGYQFEVYQHVLGLNSVNYDDISTVMANYWDLIEHHDINRLEVSSDTLIKGLADDLANGSILFSVAFYEENSQYGLYSFHAYSIEKIDTEKEIIYLTNPWYGGGMIAVPFDVFNSMEKTFNIANVDGSEVDLDKLMNNGQQSGNSGSTDTASSTAEGRVAEGATAGTGTAGGTTDTAGVAQQAHHAGVHRLTRSINRFKITSLEREIKDLQAQIKDNPDDLIAKNRLRVRTRQLRALKK